LSRQNDRACYAASRYRRTMPARACLIITLVLSLLFTPQAANATTDPVKSAMPGCAMAGCVTGCCARMACCALFAEDQRRPEQAPARQPVGIDLAVLSARIFSILRVFPTAERRLFLSEEVRAAHTLPRLAATCIQLI
jgi:hypothetical protein